MLARLWFNTDSILWPGHISGRVSHSSTEISVLGVCGVSRRNRAVCRVRSHKRKLSLIVWSRQPFAGQIMTGLINMSQNSIVVGLSELGCVLMHQSLNETKRRFEWSIQFSTQVLIKYVSPDKQWISVGYKVDKLWIENQFIQSLSIGYLSFIYTSYFIHKLSSSNHNLST